MQEQDRDRRQSIMLKTNHQIKFKEAVKKISYFLPAYDHTYVFTRVDVPGRAESIVHIDNGGTILYEYTMNSLIGQFAMLTDKEVIVANTKMEQVDIINLEERTIRSKKHKFVTDDAHQIRIFTFYHTKLICLLENSNSRLKITYYNYVGGQGPVSQFVLPKQQWGLQHRIVKVNNHSKIAWFCRAKQSQNISLQSWGLQSNPKGELSTISIKNTFNHYSSAFYFHIHNLWENEDNIFTLTASSQQQNQEEEWQRIENHNYYILDALKGTIRRAYYSFIDEDGRDWNSKIFDSFNLEQFDVFIARNIEGTSAPAFYTNNRVQKILFTNKEQGKQQVKYHKIGYQPYAYVEVQYAKSNVQHVKLTLLQIANVKQILLHFMLHINEDFNHDLLQDAIELLQ